ncbi:uncharacterized protein B0H18DRAFT_971679 [Fomitopsis serialis]|uniref:uncharacterized protein n=1 Tax=Fomitopsis serialis TaxID=139415 RepID=UPI0020085EDF|nr:uncharacterized protein B0H18DRAFT_971679 [Neoantrodia serialis]KAH9937669.1 hypothetical protein B0H18DRAFT_971679 [Neoantrodia serialis]
MFEHSYECSKCRRMLSKESIKMCSGCKTMGYCSKECQRADWKDHKPNCRGAQTGVPAPSRNPVIKVGERMAQDPDIMCLIDGILIYTLDLINHPENAAEYAVAIAAHIEYTDVFAARQRVMALIAGREPPPLPKKLPKLFQISKTAPIENKSVPEGLNKNREEQKRLLQEKGYMTGTSEKPGYLVRAFLVPENNSVSTFYFTRYINQEMLDEAATWKKYTDNGMTETDEPADTEYLIKMFDLRALEDPEMNKKLTILVAPEER